MSVSKSTTLAVVQPPRSPRLVIECGLTSKVGPYRSNATEQRRIRIRYKPTVAESALAFGAYAVTYGLWFGLRLRFSPLEVMSFVFAGCFVITVAMIARSVRTVVIDDTQLVILSGSRRKTLERIELANIRDVFTTMRTDARDHCVVLTTNDGRAIQVFNRMKTNEAQTVCDAIRECLLQQGGRRPALTA